MNGTTTTGFPRDFVVHTRHQSIAEPERLEHMPSAVPLVIDDVETAIARMTPLGRAAVEGIADQMRGVILAVVRTHGWPIVRHDDFAAWSREQIASGHYWLVLDPLLEIEPTARVQSLRASREFDNGRLRIAMPDLQLPPSAAETGIGFLDDALGTGATALALARAVQHCGSKIARIAAGCSTTAAARTLSTWTPPPQVGTFVKGECIPLHLRDACPYLPYAGTPSIHHPEVLTENGPVRVCFTSALRSSGPWRYLHQDYRVTAISAGARAAVVARLRALLTSEPTIADVRKPRRKGRSVPRPHTEQRLVRAYQG